MDHVNVLAGMKRVKIRGVTDLILGIGIRRIRNWRKNEWLGKEWKNVEFDLENIFWNWNWILYIDYFCNVSNYVWKLRFCVSHVLSYGFSPEFLSASVKKKKKSFYSSEVLKEKIPNAYRYLPMLKISVMVSVSEYKSCTVPSLVIIKLYCIHNV